jgi:hypothetical protein
MVSLFTKQDGAYLQQVDGKFLRVIVSGADRETLINTDVLSLR